MALGAQKPDGDLNLISHVIYPDGETGKIAPEKRMQIMKGLGFPPEKIHVELQDEGGTMRNLTDVKGTLAVYDKIVTGHPDSLTLIAFPGSIGGGWQTLIREAYRHILGHAKQENTHETARSVESVLKSIREGLEPFRRQNPNAGIRSLKEELAPAVGLILPDDIKKIVQSRVMLAMFSGNAHLRAEAKAAVELGLMDLSCPFDFAVNNPDAIILVLKSRLRARSL